MERKTAKILFIYTVIETTFLFILYEIYAIHINSFLAFLITLFLWNTLIFFFLLTYRKEFYNISTQEPMHELNLANKITLIRISFLPVIAFLLRYNSLPYMDIILTVSLILIFVTDFVDGKIARWYKQETKIGKMLDSMSDYALIGLVSVIYYQNNILPTWFFILILARLSLQTLGMCIYTLIDHPMQVQSTIGGKITIASVMLLYVVELLRFFFLKNSQFIPIFLFAEYCVGVLVFIFMFEKIYLFLQHQKNYVSQKKRRTNEQSYTCNTDKKDRQE